MRKAEPIPTRFCDRSSTRASPPWSWQQRCPHLIGYQPPIKLNLVEESITASLAELAHNPKNSTLGSADVWCSILNSARNNKEKAIRILGQPHFLLAGRPFLAATKPQNRRRLGRNRVVSVVLRRSLANDAALSKSFAKDRRRSSSSSSSSSGRWEEKLCGGGGGL